MTGDFMWISEFTKEELAIVLRFLQNELQGIQIVLNKFEHFKQTAQTAQDVILDLRDVVRDILDKKEN